MKLEDKGCKRAKKLGYNGKCVDCPLDPCLEETKVKLMKKQ